MEQTRPGPHVHFIDGLRAVAVLSVLVWHATKADGAAYPDWAMIGSRGVALFFVISGFCLAFPFLHAWRSKGERPGIDSATVGGFLVRRFSRIAPPFYSALVLFGVLAFTPFGLPNAGHQDTSAGSAIHDFLSDLAFMTSKQPIMNISFWTLGIEARWYLLCPLVIALYARSRLAFAAVGLGMYALYFFSPLSISDEGTLPCFMAGIVAADLVLTAHPWRRYAWIAALCLFVAAALEQSRTSGNDLSDPLWHAACFALVLAASTGLPARFFAWKPLAAVGIASYSIYLVHEPFIVSFVKAGVPRPIAALLGLAFGFAMYRLVEKPLTSKAFRSALERAIERPFLALAKPRAIEVEPLTIK